jgi:hypothetical protein
VRRITEAERTRLGAVVRAAAWRALTPEERKRRAERAHLARRLKAQERLVVRLRGLVQAMRPSMLYTARDLAELTGCTRDYWARQLRGAFVQPVVPLKLSGRRAAVVSRARVEERLKAAEWYLGDLRRRYAERPPKGRAKVEP